MMVRIRASSPFFFVRVHSRRIALVVAMVVAIAAVKMMRERSFPVNHALPVRTDAGTVRRAAGPFLHRTFQAPLRSKAVLLEVEPVRVRDAWDFSGPESHGIADLGLSAGVTGEACAAVAAAWHAHDYARAAALIAAWPDLNDRRQVLTPLLWEWVETDSAAAAQFSETLPAGVERREMLEVVVREWAERDVTAAGAWLSAQPLQADRDGAAAVLATNGSLSEQQPEAALAWAESIGAPTLRWEAAATVAVTWARRDPAAVARHFGQSPTFTNEERVRLLDYVRQTVASLP
jgi:hypothetical protein